MRPLTFLLIILTGLLGARSCGAEPNEWSPSCRANAEGYIVGDSLARCDSLILSAIIGVNHLDESSSGTDCDNGDGLLTALELGTQEWRFGRLVVLNGGRYGYQLDSIPPSIGRLTALVRLDLSNNRLARLPDSLGELQQLEQLICAANRLTSLPDSIGALVKLRYLNLAANRLTHVPLSLGRLVNLERLDLADNRIYSLPDTVWLLPKLRSVNLSGNPIAASGTIPRRWRTSR